MRRKFKTSSNQKRKRSTSPTTNEKERRRQQPTVRKRRQKGHAAASHNGVPRFGKADEYVAVELDSSDYADDSDHISLGLLEWRRRQHLDPAMNKASASTQEMRKERMHEFPPRLARAGLRADLPLWDAVNFIPALQRQPATSEPPRRRHSNEQYAEWMTKMIDCLSGSGRNWALHEFFYSDIDRAW